MSRRSSSARGPSVPSWKKHAAHPPTWWLIVAVVVGAVAAGLAGCKKDKKPEQPQPTDEPTLRIFALGGIAGEIEPCGCVKDMLGGIDHAAALIQSKDSPPTLVVGAGPMFFAEPRLEDKQHQQARMKASTLAESLQALDLAAWAPGANDWALGKEPLAELVKTSGALALAGNLSKEAGPVSDVRVVQRGSTKVGLVGVSAVQADVDFATKDVHKALLEGKKRAQGQGAEILVALLAMERGAALRLIEQVGDFHLAVLGKPVDRGAAGDDMTPPILVGKTLVLQPPNHLQAVGTVDLFIRDDSSVLEDGSGLETRQKRASLQRRVETLEERLQDWKSADSEVDAKTVAAREQDLAELKRELRQLESPGAPQEGSYFLVDLVEVKEELGEDPRVASRLLAYYKKVNQMNKQMFADREPPPVEEGQSSYLGVNVCSGCHQGARAFWDKSPHAGAYETLERDHKEFNLDCVSCHVTGYEKPGGSTVTHVANLKDVQCEVCHGPGSRHVQNPQDKSLITRNPERTLCARSCHHPPHVKDTWSVDVAWPKILGPGHGLPMPEPETETETETDGQATAN